MESKSRVAASLLLAGVTAAGAAWAEPQSGGEAVLEEVTV